MPNQTIALDFDGVLHRYGEGWKDGTIYDEPVVGAVDACWELRRRGYELVVFTARQGIAEIRTWLADHGFPEKHMQVTNTKPPALFYVDDRGIRFISWPRAMFDMAELLGKAGEP